MDLAFRDRERRTLDGRTIRGEKATRDLWVCGAGAFLVLKALAFEGRGENKDAYDLYYLLRHYGTALADVTARLKPLLEAAETQRALVILARDFTDIGAVGARRLADFLETDPNQEPQADFVGLVIELLADVDRAAKL